MYGQQKQLTFHAHEVFSYKRHLCIVKKNRIFIRIFCISPFIDNLVCQW